MKRWILTPGTLPHFPDRSGELRSHYQNKFPLFREIKNNCIGYYPITVQYYWYTIRKNVTANLVKTEGLVIKWKKKNLFWVLFLQLVGSSLFSFQQQGLRTAPEGTSQLGNQTCSSTGIVIQPGLTVVSKSCKATLVFFWSLEFAVQIHLYTFILNVFTPMHMSHAGEMLVVVVNMQIYYPLWLEIIVMLISIVFQVGLGQIKRIIVIFPDLFSLPTIFLINVSGLRE